jgi:hypothetical protein
MAWLPATVIGIVALVSAPQDRPRDSVTVGTGSVLGLVTDARTGQPVSGAIVTIAGTTRPPDTEARTDGEGRFILDHIAAGRYSITAKRGGYFDAEFGQRMPLGTGETFALGDGERRDAVDLALVKPAAISGTVLDDAGEPVVKLDVHAYRRIYVGGRPRYIAVSVDGTDDRGVFRIGRLPAGDYIVGVPVTRPRGIDDDRSGDMPRDGGAVSALPPVNGRGQVYPASYFPSGVTAQNATVITVDFGEVRRNVDLQIRPAAAMRLTGTVTLRPGMKGNPRVRLTAVDATQFEDGDIADVSASESGGFAINAIPPGQYRLQADLNGAWASDVVALSDSDLPDVRLLMRDPLRVTGRISFEGSRPDPGLAANTDLGLSIERADGVRLPQAPVFTLDNTGRNFVLSGVVPGRYLLALDRAPSTWSLKSAIYQGRDVSQAAFDVTTSDASGVVVTLTDRPAILSGRVIDATATANVVVFVFPKDPQQWVDFGPSGRGFRAVDAHAQRFDIRDLAPGDYIAIAIDTDIAFPWKTPDFLASAARTGTPFQLTEGGMRQLDLTVSSIK